MTSRERRYLPRKGRDSRGVGARASGPGMLGSVASSRQRRLVRKRCFSEARRNRDVADVQLLLPVESATLDNRSRKSPTACGEISSSPRRYSRITHARRAFHAGRRDSHLSAPRETLKGHVGARIYQSRVIAVLAIRLASESAPDKEAGHP